MYQLMVGIQHKHAQGIMHRDLKPANVLVNVKDGQVELKIGDLIVIIIILRGIADDKGIKQQPYWPYI